jgi:hypothetical protein
LAVLSNNHIIGRNLETSIGEDVSQPGIIETGCRAAPADTIGQVSALVPVDFQGGDNLVDAAIASTTSDLVRDDGYILEIGSPSQFPSEPALGMPVKKSGRTTALTFGTITALNVTANVQASRPCGAVDGIARYVGQILITPGSFIAGGDSGSLVVEDTDPCPGAVGLVFAGNSTVALANPISLVLNSFNATLAGCPPAGPIGQAGAGLTKDHPALAAVIAVQKQYEEDIMKIPGVVGTGVGLSTDGPVFEIYLDGQHTGLELILPNSLDQIEVRLVETGPFEFI